MRQLAAFFLLFIYVGLASGISLHLHYCSGDVKSVSILGNSETCCGESSCCSAGMHESCCDDAFLRLGPEIPYAKPEFFFPVFCLSDEPVATTIRAEAFDSIKSYEECSGPKRDSSPPPYIAFSCLKYCG